MDDCTPKQRAILRFMAHFRETHGGVPSAKDISERFSCHVSTTYEHLDRLKEKGYLDIHQPGKRRPLRIRLTEKTERHFTESYPLYGAITAGPVAEAGDAPAQNIESIRDLLPMMRTSDYLLTADGDSMIGAGIESGMVLVMRPDKKPRPGAICAVWVDGNGGTLKRIYFEDDRVRLAPENDAFPEKSYPADQVHVQGVLVATLDIRPVQG